MRTEWNTFTPGVWQHEINVRDFIQKNYTPYDGDDAFLEGPTKNTEALWNQVMELSAKEREAGGVLDMDTKIISTITSHGPGYLDKDKETIVGFQTDKPFKRALQPYGGIRMAVKACQDNGYEVDPEIVEFFTKHRKTHNAGVFDAYTDEMRACRSSHIITGLPDAYGRGRIIGDYRRIALYGVDALIQEKDRALQEMRRLNDAIEDEIISRRIDQLEDTTGKIIDQVVAHPEKLSQIRTFMNYYLPTTLKILNAYDRMGAAGVSGENIDSTMQRIETMMDTIVMAFHKQLDALFRDDAMDIASDITVMENLLAQEGLGGARPDQD